MTRSILPVAGLAAFLMLTGCMEDMPGPERPRPPHKDGPMCTREYAPVCAVRGRKQKTFSNACMARAKDYVVIRPGTCNRPQ